MGEDATEKRLRSILEPGLSPDPLAHAEQVAAVASILHEAFTNAGLTPTVVGGSAIELHAPGVYVSRDMDMVIEGASFSSGRIGTVFEELGFTRRGRHWSMGDLFVEVPSTRLTDPSEVLQVGPWTFRVIAKEVMLADRIVGFRQWGVSAWGQQAIDLLAAFGDDLDEAWLEERLQAEGSLDALVPLRNLAESDEPVDRNVLDSLLARLGGD